MRYTLILTGAETMGYDYLNGIRTCFHIFADAPGKPDEREGRCEAPRRGLIVPGVLGGLELGCRKFQIPPDLVVKFQAIDIAEVIRCLIRRRNAAQGW